ncbi:LamG domain-containing protein [Nonomuraea angiospora]|uniref:LamG-like jellyroll fold domain-containing protein n=1 Tax=Nonomuraea angiospora TaxID=46172 RepID=A0ABR9MIH4_9ACTN|nr:LamG domain-containing protein [Nonomuraea angiospora]MBE1592345.1 hypothetical protein [Nonomuraea angiospora]
MVGLAVSDPAVGALQVTPSEQVNGTTVTPTRTPSLLAQVVDPAGKPLRAEAEIEHDPAAPEGQGTGQIWSGAVDDVASGTQAGITVPADTLTDGWKVRWRLRAVAGDASSAWSDWQQVTVDVIHPGEEPLAATSGPVIRTDQSFSVAAWLRWSDKDGDYTVVEQKGAHQAPFRLGNTADHGLVLTFTDGDTTDATFEGVLTGVEPPVNEWFHLAGVYDATGKVATVYLNGSPVKSAPVNVTPWNAETSMTLGTSMLGDLDETRVYQRPLSAQDVAGLHASAGATTSAVAPAREQTGTTEETEEGKDGKEEKETTPEPRTTAGSTVAAGESFPYNRVSTRQCQNLWETKFPNQPQGTKSHVMEYWRVHTYCTSRHHHWQIYSDSKKTKVGAVIISATAVMKAYVGGWKTNGEHAREDASNPGTAHHPRDIDVWVRIDDVVYTESKFMAPIMETDDHDVTLEIKAKSSTPNGATCNLTNSKVKDGAGRPVSTITKDAEDWKADSQVTGKDEYWFTFRSTATKDKSDVEKEAYHGISYCTIRPYISIEDKGWLPDIRNTVYSWIGLHAPTVPMWDRPRDATEATDNAPTLRCDLSDNYTAYYGGCIFNKVSRIYRMSRVDPPGAKAVSLVAEHLWHTRELPDQTVPDETTTDSPRKPITGKKFPGHWPGTALHNVDKKAKTADGVYVRGRNKTMKTKICNLDYTAAERAGKECDEYPFNNTKEGPGYRADDHDPHSQSWNFSIRPVLIEHNKNAGNHKQLFEVQNRVFHKDAFWVSVI